MLILRNGTIINPNYIEYIEKNTDTLWIRFNSGHLYSIEDEDAAEIWRYMKNKALLAGQVIATKVEEE